MGHENYPVETMMKVAFLKSFPLKKKKKEKEDEKTESVSQSKGARRDGPAAGGGEQGHPSPWALMGKGLGLAGRLFTGSHARHCICERALG